MNNTGSFLPITTDNVQVTSLQFTQVGSDPVGVSVVAKIKTLNTSPLDFIITKQDLVKKESTLVVAITQKKQLDFYLNLIKQTKFTINTITVDLVGIFSLYSLIYADRKSQYQILLELGKNSITISYLWQGQLWLVRNLPYGLNSIISKIYVFKL